MLGQIWSPHVRCNMFFSVLCYTISITWPPFSLSRLYFVPCQGLVRPLFFFRKHLPSSFRMLCFASLLELQQHAVAEAQVGRMMHATKIVSVVRRRIGRWLFWSSLFRGASCICCTICAWSLSRSCLKRRLYISLDNAEGIGIKLIHNHVTFVGLTDER